MKKYIFLWIFVFVISLLVFFAIWLNVTPSGVALRNTWFFNVQKAEDRTDYDTLKKVEDTCRAMIASYTKDKLTYEQFKNSDDKDEKTIATQARMRANNTASSYNEYILKNSFVWKDDIPSDIYRTLEYIVD